MNKKEFIETLISMMGGYDAKQGIWERGWDDATSDIIEIAEELDEPKKPVIPKFVADWIEKQMKFGYEDVFISMTRLRERAPEKVKFWFRNNSDTYARAWLDGYEVEKEKLRKRVKYQVIIRDGEYIRLYLCKHGDNVIIGTNDDYIEKYPEVTHLTEKEIKDYDERYWVFAKEVTPCN